MISGGLDKQLLSRLRRDFATTSSLFGPGKTALPSVIVNTNAAKSIPYYEISKDSRENLVSASRYGEGEREYQHLRLTGGRRIFFDTK